MYTGMNQQTGQAISDMDHISQSVQDILLTPQGSRIARREYGSLLSRLIDQPQNEALNLQVMAAIYSALNRWEPRITLNSVMVNTFFNGAMQIDLTGRRNDGVPLSISITTR